MMKSIECNSIGEAWTESCKCISSQGLPMKDGEQMLKELLHFAVTIKNPSENDEIVKRFGDKAMVDWMLANFLEQKRVPELKNALSYGTRLFNLNGKNQIEWVIKRIKDKPECKSATISLILPDDDGYVPCVSMLDFKIRASKLVLTVFCRSIDFGNKVYANMIALHRIQELVAKALAVKSGEIVMCVVSAHIYDKDYGGIQGVLEALKNG